MAAASARTLRLLALLQSQRAWTGTELADRLEVTDRTLRRDVERLRSLGYPVRSTPGVGGGYQMVPGSTMPPLVLGHEDRGVTTTTLAACDLVGFIPQLGKVGSLNVATAAAIAVYEVRRGDNLTEIARLHQMSLRELRDLNGITGSVIHPGQRIRLPA